MPMKITTFRNLNAVFFTISLLFNGMKLYSQGTSEAFINAPYVNLNDASNNYGFFATANVATYSMKTPSNSFFIDYLTNLKI